MGFCPIWGIWQGAGTPATSQMRCWLLPPSSAQAPYPSPRRKRQVSSIPLRLLSKSQSRCWIAILLFSHVGAMLAFAPLPRTLAGWVESRTQWRHAPHGAVQALGTPAGSIVPIVFTGRKSALSARLREIHRLPLLRYVSAKIPFSLRAATLSRTSRVIFFGVIPSVPSGSIFADSADGGPRYVESARSNSERSFVS